MGTYVTFDRESRPSSRFKLLSNRDLACAQSRGAVVHQSGSSLVIADSREEGTDTSALSKAVNLFLECLKLPQKTTDVPAAIDSAFASSNEKFCIEAPSGNAVLLGSLEHRGVRYLYNQGGGMIFLLKRDGRVTCLTDHLLPDHPEFAVLGFVSPGEILLSDTPLRSQPFVTVGNEKYHAARGLGYPKEIPTQPLITILKSHESEGGEYILYVTQEGAQNVQRNEIEAAWKEVQGTSSLDILESITSWLERRCETEEPRMAVVLQRLSLIPKPLQSFVAGKVNRQGSRIPVRV